MRNTLAFLALSLLVACGSDSSTGTQSSAAGTYTLRTVNGANLPFIAQAANPKIEVLSDQLILTSSGTFTQTTSVRTTTGSSVSTSNANDSGTYSVTGTAATFRFADGSTGTGTLSGNSLTVVDGGATSVYMK